LDLDVIEKLKSTQKKIPPIEKLFGCAWIICWFTAIWIYHIQLIITGLFCLFLSYVIFERTDIKGKEKLPALFSMDKNTKILTVQKIYNSNLNWEDSEICSGNATLPSGPIKEGDVVVNCNGNVALRHIPTNTLMGAYNFK
jgi:hypothetical protein